MATKTTTATAVILRLTIPKAVRVPKMPKKKTREQRDEYIRLWQEMAIDLNMKP